MIGRVKRQSGSEATKHPVFPEQGNAVHYGRQPVEKYFFDVRFCICLLNNNLKIVLLHLKGGASSRVVYRGSSYAYPNGGVSMSHASYDSSYTSTSIGSRLNNNRKEILIGVQHRGLVPTVVPRGASRSNSGP